MSALPECLLVGVPPGGVTAGIIAHRDMLNPTRKSVVRRGGRSRRTTARHLVALAAASATVTALLAGAAPAGAATPGAPPGAPYSPGEVVVRYADGTSPRAWEATARSAGGGATAVVAEHTRLLRLARGVTVAHALRTLRRQHDVVWATPDYEARTSGASLPNDPGLGGPGDWEKLQWNFDGQFGVGAPEAWSNVASEGAPGGRGVIVAVLDTGVAYADRGRYERSPDFDWHTFVAGYDFVSGTPYPNDHNGHGTFVAGTIAEATDNHFGLTGLAWGVKLMPVRVLNNEGEGYAATIAKGVMFAVRHGARVINMSLEFSSDITAADIPVLIDALRYAHRHGVVVVAAAGNEGHASISYPARAPHVIAVGASTEHGCLADYSNYGPGLTLVAPGGGPDAALRGDPNCRPEEPGGRDIYQITYDGLSARQFGLPSGYEGTSMAAPHVAATAALIIAGGVLGRSPSPSRITARLKATARQLGGPEDASVYGAGLLDAAAATARGGPGAVG